MCVCMKFGQTLALVAEREALRVFEGLNERDDAFNVGQRVVGKVFLTQSMVQKKRGVA